MIFFKPPKKSLGQNFLIDQNIINKIIQIAEIKKNKTILEIGAGYGNLTKKIAAINPRKIIAIENSRQQLTPWKYNICIYGQAELGIYELPHNDL